MTHNLPTLLLVTLLHLVAFSTVAAETQPTAPCDVHALINQQDYDTATACIKVGANPNVRNALGRGPLNRLLWFGRGLSVLNDKTQPFIESLVDAGADLNYRPPNQEASAFEALLEEGVHITARPLVRRMLLREKTPVDLNASVSLRREPPHDERRRLTPLLWAIKVGDVEIAALLLKRGADPNQIPAPGMAPPLHHAVRYNQPEIIRLLHQHGADIRTVSPWPILDAVNNDYTETTQETLRTVLELGATAAIADHEAWLLRLLTTRKQGSKLLSEAQFALIAPYLRIDFSKPGATFLEQLLVDNGDAQRTKSLPAYRAAFLHALQAGANPNGSRSYTKSHGSLLQLLVTLGEDDLLLEKTLLERGADPNLADKDGDTPLHQVALSRNELKTHLAKYPEDPAAEIRISRIETIEQLRELTRYVSGRPDRVTALTPQILRMNIEAKLRRLDDLEHLLLTHGADVRLKNCEGLTPKAIETSGVH